MIEPILNQLRGKRILIAGFGREGKSSLRFIKRYLPDAEVSVADINPGVAAQLAAIDPALVFYSGAAYLDQIASFDLLLKSPGLSLNKPLPNGVQLSSQTDLFMAAYHRQVIGISGTKGKSTSSALIYHMLVSNGLPALLTGNMGFPCFDIIPELTAESIVVFELSAHQLEYVRHSPGTCVLLNIFEEHLDHFGSMEKYRAAKLNLIRYAGINDAVIVHQDLKNFVAESLSVIRTFPETIDFPLPSALKAAHNRLNIEAALHAVSFFGIEKEAALKSLSDFKALPHRLQYLGKSGGIHFYNDSIATIPEAVIAALRAIPQTNYLILGGFDRGIHYDKLVHYLLDNPVRVLFYTGKAGQRIADMLKSSDYLGNLIAVENLAEVFAWLKQHAKTGETCLLSPAAASYDQYENFEQRGEVFSALVKEFESFTG
ncbi:MAG: UDP-N-acetylmuramoyl-L-alanine--D-glutamate ligase [Bacteroidetes bacterium]|jgi:UDP-N-acetylmuramoylalanine--D-glutamate ligase|nr:UDP-N-acetylmuramoyl-L-alanine--D-glutamate ligase [Bacteroidota bacterium]